MVTQLQDVSNTVAQEKISNQRLRNEEIRRQMANPWSEPKEPTTSGRQPLQDVTKGTPTLASTYSGLLSNYQGMTGTSSNSGQTGNNYNQKPYTGNPNPLGIPSWAPMAVGTGLNIADAGIAAPLGAAATSLMRGDRAGAVGTLAGLFINDITEGKVPGLAGLAGTLASGLVGDKSANEIGQGLVNSGFGTLLSMANPLAGIAYSLARNLGFNPARGISDYSKSDIDQRFDSGYQGGFWGSNSWVPTSVSGSGEGNITGPGTGSGYVPSSNPSGYDTGSAYGSSGYGPKYSSSSSSSSSSYSSSGYTSSGSWSSYSSGSAYSSDSDSSSSDGGW